MITTHFFFNSSVISGTTCKTKQNKVIHYLSLHRHVLTTPSKVLRGQRKHAPVTLCPPRSALFCDLPAHAWETSMNTPSSPMAQESCGHNCKLRKAPQKQDIQCARSVPSTPESPVCPPSLYGPRQVACLSWLSQPPRTCFLPVNSHCSCHTVMKELHAEH